MNGNPKDPIPEVEAEFEGLASLPRFTPPGMEQAPSAPPAEPPAASAGPQGASEPPVGVANEAGGADPVPPALAEALAPREADQAPEGKADAPEAGPGAGKGEGEAPTKPDAKEDLQQSVGLDALRAVVEKVLSERGDPSQPRSSLSNEELRRVAEQLTLAPIRPEQLSGEAPVASAVAPQGPQAPQQATVQVGPGERVQIKGGAALAEGLGALAGGAMALAGAAGKAVGAAARGVADVLGSKEQQAAAEATSDLSQGTERSIPMVLPRLSEYRLAQVEKARDAFDREQEGFWNSSTKLVALRDEMQRLARERGLAVQDVAEKMKPGGDLADLRERFNAAVSENPDAQTRKRAMDKALDSYVRQYGRAQEELLNPEQKGNPHYEGLKARLHDAHDDMEQKTKGVPAFANDKGELEPSHFEKLKEAIAKLMERLKEVAQEFIAMLRGKSRQGDNHAPAP